MKLCEFGCEKEAKFLLKNGKKCCSKSQNSCPEMKKKNRNSNKRKTKENCEGRRRQAEKITGRTKENDVGRRDQARKITGRTKENDDSIRRMARKIEELWKDPMFRTKTIKTQLEAANKPERREQLKDTATKLWKDSNFQQKQYKARRETPNKPETLILNVLDKCYPNEWKYTGDYSFWINGRNPDFTNVNGQKKLIEHFGTYWHKNDNPQELIDHYKKWGWETLVIWEYDLKNMKKVERKIKKFIEKKVNQPIFG